MTWDRGKEMADHKRFTIATNVQVYFCDPRSPWQRGSNENTNGLLRQYFPKGTDLSQFSQAYLNKIALRLNQRPRRPWGLKLLPIDYERCCSDRLNPPPKADIATDSHTKRTPVRLDAVTKVRTEHSSCSWPDCREKLA